MGLRLEMLGGEIFESLGNVGDSTVHAVHLLADWGLRIQAMVVTCIRSSSS